MELNLLMVKLFSMIKSRTTQLIYKSIYIGISIIAILASFGLFDMSFRWDFYIHFTNLSNYLCIIVILIELIDTAKRAEDGFVKTFSTLKFTALLSILLTSIIYNFILSSTRDIKDSFVVGSITLHIILPLMFVFDYILFCEHGKLKWYYPIVATSFPLTYAGLVYINAFIMKFDTNILSYDKSVPFIYPYFFLNLEKLGVNGVIKNIILITIFFIIFGYVVMAIDKLLSKIN